MKNFVIISLLFFLVSSCGLFGIRFNLKNPKREGQYPSFSKETIELGTLTSLRQKFDVEKYDLDVTFYPDQKSIKGKVDISFKTLSDLDTLQLDLDKRLTIESIYSNGEKLNFYRSERSFFVIYPKKLAENSQHSVVINYQGKPLISKKPPWVGGFVWEKDKEKKLWAGVACESEGASIWFPCKDHTSDEPNEVVMRYSIPSSELTVVGNGKFIGKKTANGFDTFEWKVSHPINLYNVTFYIGNYVEIKDTFPSISGRNVDVSYYVLKENEEKAKSHFKQVFDQLKFFEETYGEYPFYLDGYRLVESPYEGMEHQSAIAYGNGYKNDLEDKFDYIILHESGHEWFGNAITSFDMKDMWLQEGITTYSEALFLEKNIDALASLRHLFFYRLTIKNKRPLVGPVDRRYFSYKDSDVYVKAAWVLHTLRFQINNDEQFFKILKEFYQRNKYKVSDSDDFIKVVNEITRKDYNWFFNQYLYNHKVPEFHYYLDKDEKLYFKLAEVKDEFKDFKILVKSKSINKAMAINPTTELKSVEIGTDNIKDVKIITDFGLFKVKKNKSILKNEN